MGVRTGPPHDFAIHHRCVGVQARCCIRDGLEPRRPIVAAAGEHADGALPYLKLNSVTIVFDLMQPSVAAGRLGHHNVGCMGSMKSGKGAPFAPLSSRASRCAGPF
jgi:hypothetical protein